MNRMLFTALVSLAVVGVGSPVRANPSVRYIQRTMGKLASSTAENPAHVKILFYGQSTVEGSWHTGVVDDLKRRFPTARIEAENRAVGGFEAPTLVRMLESDVYPFYPDIIFFQDWGDYESLREVIRRIRANTTAEIVLWTDHVRAKGDLKAALREDDSFSRLQRRIAEEEHCMLIPLRRKWAKHHLDNALPPTRYISPDGVHMTTEANGLYAGFIAEELVRLDGATPDKAGGEITTVAFDKGVRKLPDGSLEFAFTGNRVEALVPETCPTYRYASSPVKILLDGREMSGMKELYGTTRPSGIMCWMPAVLHVGFDTVPVAEDWTMTFLEGTEKDGSAIRYRVDGSVTGYDGEGWSTNDFVSTSGRVRIDRSDIFSWAYDYHYRRRGRGQCAALPGQWTCWRTERHFTDRLGIYPGVGARVVLVTGCSNARHKLTFVPAVPSKPPKFTSLVVYRPAKRIPKEIVLKPGVRELSETMDFDADCSGCVVRSEDPAHPAVLSGGRRIRGWRVGADGVWRTTLDEVKSGRWDFNQLYVNGSRRFRPRIPESGFLMTGTNAWVEAKTIGGFSYGEGDVDPKMANLDDVEVLVLHNWAVTRERIAEIDGPGRLIRFKVPRTGANPSASDFTNRRYRLENVKEAFGRPGEWYLDRPSGELAYTPLPGEDPETAEVVAPYLGTLVRVDGARDIVFRDVVFSCQNLLTPDAGCYASQAAYNLAPAVEVTHAQGIRFDGCAFVRTGGYGLFLDEGAVGCTVENCLFRDLGGGGIRIGSYKDRNQPDPQPPASNTVVNCRITEGGRYFPAAVGVLIGRSSWNRVIHNEIDYLYYTGISCGWNWDSSRPSKAHHNEIAFNHVHDIGQNILSDMGLVYLLGRAPGTTVHDNNLHDIRSSAYGGTGIYPDEGSSELKIWNNAVRNTIRSYHQNYGECNEVWNNIFVNGRENQWDCRPDLRLTNDTLRLHNNIFVWKTGSFMSRNWPFGGLPKGVKPGSIPYWQNVNSDSNVYWCCTGQAPVFGRMPVKEWREKSGNDRNSPFDDPGFSGDCWSGDYRLKPDSLAVKFGFKPFDLSRAGLKDANRLPKIPDWEACTPYADVTSRVWKAAGELTRK